MNQAKQKQLLKRYGFNDEDPLLEWLNASMHEIEAYADWPFLETRTTLASTAGVDTLVFPTDLFKIKDLRDDTDFEKLTRWDRTRFDREVYDPTRTGRPTIYVVTGMSTIQLWPIPDTNEIFHVVYQPALTEMVEDPTATSPLPLQFHYPQVIGAAYIALMAESEEERAARAESQFQTSLARLFSKFFAGLDEEDQVVDVQNYGC